MFRSSSTHVRLAWAAFAALMAVAIAWSLNRAPAPPVTAAKAPSTAPPIANLKTVALTKPSKKSAKKPGKTVPSGPAAQFKSLKATKAPKKKFRPREVLVTFADGASASERKALRASVGATSHEDLGGNTEKLVLPKGVSTKDAAAALAKSANVAAADRNAVYHILVAPNDALYADQWSLNNGFDTDIDAEEGWAASSTSTTPVTVAVVDTGIDYSHPDLVNQVWTNAGEYGSGKQTNGLDDDGNGLVDDWRGYDFYNGDNNATDDNAHGTHVAGIIAAQRGNSTGIAGVSSQAKILPLKVFSSQGYGDDAAIIKAFQYAVAKGAKVINGSFGGSYNSNVVSQYVQSQTGTTFVFAAGNDGKSLDTGDSFPCEIPGNQVICVGATGTNGQSAPYSDYSTTQVDLVAPGSDVLSTVPTALSYNGYAKFSGTSMASPTVAGAAAVLVSKFPTLTPAQLRTRLTSTVDPALTPGKSASGRLNLAGAIANAPVAYSATGSASVSAGRVTYTAAAGGLNTVTVLASGSTVTVEDTGVTTLTPGTGCTTVTAKKVSCGSITAVTINSGDLGDTITADVPLPVTVNSGTGPSVIRTGAGVDTITGGDEVDDVDPGDGNDTITLAGGNDRVFRWSGGDFPPADGNDTIYAGAGNDSIYDYVGSNVIYGGSGDDSFPYSINPSQYYGEDGNDVFSVLGDGHTVNGGNGNDWIWVDPGHNRSFTGGAGTDMVAYAEYDDDVQVVLGGSSLNGTEGDNDTIAADVEDAMGGRGEDVLYGSSGPNRLIGGIGDDGVYGNGGDDVLDQWLDGYENSLNAPGATGTDVLYGGTGIDTVTYLGPQGEEVYGAPAAVNASIDGVANDVLVGFPGPDNISTTVENLTGTTEDDTLTGNDVANVLIGGGGNDVLAGLGGTDSYVGDRPGGCGVFCTDGTKDAVTYASQTGPIAASLDGLANDGVSGEIENIPASIEKLIGSSAADTLTAGAASATLVGGPGADTLRGGASNDILIANDGVVDAVLECKGGSGDYILKDATDVANADCESVTTSDAPETTITSGPETGSYVSTSPTFTFTSNKPGSTFECADDTTTAGTYFPCTSPWKTAQRANGDVRVYKIRAKSSTGVVETSPEMFAIWYDTVAPDTTITGGPAYGSTVLTNTVSVPFTSTGETVTYECQYDLGAWNACTSPFTTPTLTAGEHELRFRTKDAVGNRGAQTPLQFKRESQLLTVPGGAIPVGTFNLTTSGGAGNSLDWIHWGSTSSSTFERKNATQRISTWSNVGSGVIAALNGANQYTWSDAIAAPTSATTQVGISRQLNNGAGFKFSVPATNGETRKLRVFVGVRGAATVGTLSVGFGSQTPVTQTVNGSSGATATTTLTNVFTIDYRPFAPTDTLNVEFKQTAGGSATGTAVLLYAAALY